MEKISKQELVSMVTETLKEREVRKPIRSPRHVFHISDDEGNSKDFVVKQVDKSVSYNTKDVMAIINTFLELITDAVERGDLVALHGFGTFTTRKRSARSTIHPQTGEPIDVAERWVPKFIPGKNLKFAARALDLEDTEGEGDS